MPVNYGKQKTLWKQIRILGKNLFLFMSSAWLSHFFSVRFTCKELVDLPDSAFSVFFYLLTYFKCAYFTPFHTCHTFVY